MMRVMQRFIRDESGMTMGLVVIMIVLIGVMGAGLLTFVSTDLNTVVEVNRGQRAFEMAEAGVQAAKRQLRVDPEHSHYDGGVDDVEWATGKVLTDLDDSPATVDKSTVTIKSLGSPDGPFRVVSTGQYGAARRVVEAIVEPAEGVNLPEAYRTNATSICKSNTRFQLKVAADLIVEGDSIFDSNCSIDINGGNIIVGGSTTFNSNVDIQGSAGIFIREDASFDSNANLNGARLYVGRDAAFNSNTTVSNGSIYVGRNATFNSNSRLEATSLFSGGDVVLNSNNFSLGNAVDGVYGNWQNADNPTARSSNLAGIGAVGTISGPGAINAFIGSRSYDSTTGDGVSTGTRFVSSGAVSPTTMTFPFDPAEYSAPLNSPAGPIEASRMTQADIDALRERAQEQEAETGADHYREVASGTTYTINSTQDWPISSSDVYGYGTVVFYKFPSFDPNNKILWDVSALCTDTSRKGILVVENGNLEAGSNSSGFNGWMIAWNGTFTADSNTCLNAFINTTGGMTFNSNAEIHDPLESTQQDLSIFRRTSVLSWRECYSIGCN